MFGRGYKTLEEMVRSSEKLSKLRTYMGIPDGYEVRLYSSDRAFKNEIKSESDKSAEDFLKN